MTQIATEIPTAEKATAKKRNLIWLVVLVSMFLVIGVWNVVFEIKITPSKRFLLATGQISPTPTPSLITAQSLAAQVVPQAGYQVDINWGETGKKLITAGGINLSKYEENYDQETDQDELEYLKDNIDKGITISAANAYFWVNTLWALGLTQKSDVLDKGVMGTEYRQELGDFASTAGWTLGAKDAVKLYSSATILELDEQENQRVMEIASNIYRPCCGNSAAFPDCNHGMAILGLVELMVDQGFAEAEIYQAALAFNSYWFPQTYTDLAYYFKTREKIEWQDIDAKKVLGLQYSSSAGYRSIKQLIQDAPTLQQGGGSCGA